MARDEKRKRLMNPDPAAPDQTRRRLLTGGALTVAASAAVLGRPEATDGATASEPPDNAKLEYRVTDHIAAYYARARG